MTIFDGGMNVNMLFIHAATVTTYAGEGPRGPVYGAPFTVSGLLSDGEKLASEPGGQETVGQTTFACDLSYRDRITPGSKLTCNGRDLIVREVAYNDGGGLLAAVSHLRVVLS